jgi:3-dehydroquinate dehydratase / shikimate dehydrogenase
MAALFGRDRICGVVAAVTPRDMFRQLAAALHSTSTVELRLDYLRDAREIRHFLAQLSEFRRVVPRIARATLIATCRRKDAGGKFRGSPAAQLDLLRLAAKSGCAWLDLEIETAAGLSEEEWSERASPAGSLGSRQQAPGPQSRRRTQTSAPAPVKPRWMISHHDFRATPAQLKPLLARMERLRADAYKIATQAQSLREAVRVCDLARPRQDVVAVPMGELGLPARILALRGGSALAYASVETATAPGQASLADMKTLYRADAIDAQTRVYGVIGDPIGHSLSPVMHNAALRARKVHGVFLPFRVTDLRDFLRAIEPMGIRGFSVTLPHKARILRYLDECDPLAADIGAVNTVVVRGAGKLYGYNTDYTGVLHAMQKRMTLRGAKVLLFGAGGSARAAAFALAGAGASVVVCARRPARASELARAVGGETVPRRALRGGARFDAIVNATPVGMYPHPDASPLDAAELNCRVVFDLIYRPQKTRLLQLAAQRGIETISGLEMFVAQGAAQFEIFTGMRPPVAAMRRAVESVLQREEKERSKR